MSRLISVSVATNNRLLERAFGVHSLTPPSLFPPTLHHVNHSINCDVTSLCKLRYVINVCRAVARSLAARTAAFIMAEDSALGGSRATPQTPKRF